MFSSPPLQRNLSSHRQYPRLALCDVVYQVGPAPVPAPDIHAPLVLHPPVYDADWTVESTVIASIAAQREKEEEEVRQRERRRRELEKRREMEEERKRRDEERKHREEEDERRRQDEEERREAEEARRRQEADQEKLRTVAEAYKKQRAAVEAFSQGKQPPPPLRTAERLLPVAHPPRTAASSLLPSTAASSLPSSSSFSFSSSASASTSAVSSAFSASPAAVRSFCSITGVSDDASSGLLLSLLDNDVDHAVNLYFSDDPPSLQSAIERAIAIQDRNRR